TPTNSTAGISTNSASSHGAFKVCSIMSMPSNSIVQTSTRPVSWVGAWWLEFFGVIALFPSGWATFHTFI
ncbi:MAG: hypothetical protein U1C71_04815, partial [archaeon]|nr:hypothetical protein [archaeon]